jgi:hypothetical protein
LQGLSSEGCNCCLKGTVACHDSLNLRTRTLIILEIIINER